MIHIWPYGPIWVARGEKSQVKKVKINISDRDFFLGLVQGDLGNSNRKSKFARPLAQGVLDPIISNPSESFELPIFKSSKLIQFIELTARTRGQP